VWLDVMRFVAMFTVVCCHCADPFNFYPGDVPANIADIKFWGATYGALLRPCVPLFVMITGALLLGHYLRKQDWPVSKILAIGVPMFLIGYAVTFLGFRHVTSLPDFTDEQLELFFTYNSLNVVMMTAPVFMLVKKISVFLLACRFHWQRLLLSVFHGLSFLQFTKWRARMLLIYFIILLCSIFKLLSIFIHITINNLVILSYEDVEIIFNGHGSSIHFSNLPILFG